MFSWVIFRITSIPPTQEKGLVVGGIDISDPSKIPKIEWKAICAQLLILNFQQQAVVAKCSTKVANLLEASKSKCQVGGDSEPDVCKQLEQVVSLFLRTRCELAELMVAMCGGFNFAWLFVR